jgi:hypothetical protein
VSTAPTNDILLGPLEQSITSGHCIAFIGAGVSRPDYPDWRQLTAELARACDIRTIEGNSEDPLAVAEIAKKTKPAIYQQTLTRLFARKAAYDCARRYHLLLRAPFVSYVTTNLDPVLHDTADLQRSVFYFAYPYFENGRYGPDVLFLIHGELALSDSHGACDVVLTTSEFEHAYSDKSRLPSILQEAFLQHDVCFLGCSLHDVHLKRVFETCKSLRENFWRLDKRNRPEWFLLLREDEATSRDFEEETGIRIVRYPTIDDSFVALDTLLARWAKAEPPKRCRPEDRRQRTSTAFQASPEVPHE